MRDEGAEPPFFQWFPSRGLTSEDWDSLSLFGKVVDYFWHLTLPIIAMAIGSFTTMAFLTKNSFLDEIRKQYVTTARSKGLGEREVLYGHVFRNAMLIIIAGFPATFIGAFFSGSLLIETIFSLDGLGLLGFESAIKRDYAVVFATLYIFALMGLVVNVITDFIYTLVDPRIDFNWGRFKPTPELNETNFSVRWTGKLTPPESGNYTLGFTADDGARLYLDGQLLVEAWSKNPNKTATKEVRLVWPFAFTIFRKHTYARFKAV